MESEKVENDNQNCANDITDPGEQKEEGLEGLIWENGIGTLPGSDLKFRMNGGEIEMITESFETIENETEDNEEAENTENFMEEEEKVVQNGVKEEKHEGKKDMDKNKESKYPNNHVIIGDDEEQDAEEQVVDEKMDVTTKDKEEVESNNSDIVTCLICGKEGTAQGFRGKFCSRTCLGRNAARRKKMRNEDERRKQSIDENTHPMVISDDNNLKIKIRLPSSPDDTTTPLPPKRRISNASSTSISEKPERKRKKFDWMQYLEKESSEAVPVSVFEHALSRPPFPEKENPFKTGMGLEAVDPIHQSLICCLSVAETRGFRIRLHFEGYNELYDFWTLADSPYIFSCGFCQKTGRKLTVPRGYTDESFSWSNHMKKYKLFPAPKHLFEKNEKSVEENLFECGQKLEAVDKQNPDLTCVATVTDKVANHILVHFDGWAHDFDYWCHIGSNYIHPVGWCQDNDKLLSPPEGYPDISNFTWEKYLKETGSIAADEKSFKRTQGNTFTAGMKLEAVDKRNQVLVRVASVAEVDGFRLKVHFDGWSDTYDWWFDVDSEDLHPIGWCSRTGHALQPPPVGEDLVPYSGQGGCPIPGCNGIGHVKGSKFTGHYSEFGCPYSQQNLNYTIPDRLVPSKMGRNARMSPKHGEGKRRYNPNPIDDEKDPDFLMDKEPRYKRKALRHSMSAVTGTGRRRRSSNVPTFPTSKNNKLVVPSCNINNLVDQNGDSYYSSQQHSVFISALSSYPSYDLPLCWEQQTRLLPDLPFSSVDDVATWSRDKVGKFVKAMTGNPEHSKIFIEHEIDGEALLLLTQGDIAKVLKIKLGPALKIYNAILLMKTKQFLPI